MTAFGVVFRPQVPPERLRSAAGAAEAAGLDELWLWEDCFAESGIAAAAAALAWTSRIRVCIGLLPVPLRNVALTAMEVATLARLFPGRVEVGVGHGVQSWMGQAGVRAESPLTLLREYLTALRALLAGERVTMSGRYVRLDGVKLEWPPEVMPRLLCGATGPKTMAVAGELADGTILVAGTPPSGIRAARAQLAAAGARDDHHVVAYVMAAHGAEGQGRLDAEYDDWKIDASLDVGVAGDAAAIAAAVDRWAAAGASSVVLQPTGDEPDLDDFMRFAGQDVGPLIRR
jgi:alkanesulfonate monooxygenase SsuD/methylene tetrahydromethanopterin reductase-like flavin-dependent oxidoreductase (luciferase family)